MRPPICSYCGSRFPLAKTRGTTLSFAISDEDKASNQRMRELRRPHHPRGLHWICEDHIDMAQALTHLRWPEARAKMDSQLNKS